MTTILTLNMKRYDQNNDEGAFLEQNHIWEQPQASKVQHGRQRVSQHQSYD